MEDSRQREWGRRQVAATGALQLAIQKTGELKRSLSEVTELYDKLASEVGNSADKLTLRRLELRVRKSLKHATKLVKGFPDTLDRADSALGTLNKSMGDNLSQLRFFDLLRNPGMLAEQ